MTNYNVNGFGGVRLGYAGYNSAVFPYSFNDITYSPVIDKIENANNKIFYRFRGYRKIVKVELYSVDDNMYQQIQNLIAVLNTSMSDNSGIYITMHWASSNNTNILLSDMLWNSDFSLEDLLRLEGAQKIKLDFISQELCNVIPSFVNAPVRGWIDQDDDTLVDGAGNTIVFR